MEMPLSDREKMTVLSVACLDNATDMKPLGLQQSQLQFNLPWPSEMSSCKGSFNVRQRLTTIEYYSRTFLILIWKAVDIHKRLSIVNYT